MRRGHFQKLDLNSLLQDKEVVEELLQLDELRALARNTSTGGLETMVTAQNPSLEEILSTTPFPGVPSGLEAIVLRKGRPVLLIQDDTFQTPSIEAIKTRLNDNRDSIESVIPKVARVELLNSPDYTFIGTAWVIDDEVLITNRHVASFFARKGNGEFMFKLNPYFEPYKVQVDFKEEYDRPTDSSRIFEIVKVLHIEPDNDFAPDMAFIKVKSNHLPEPIEFSNNTVNIRDHIGVVGYPAYDTRNDSDDMDRIFGGIYNVKRLSPGMVSGANSDYPYFTHDCTTLGGNSGSLVFNLVSGKAIGLHFAGRFLDANYAVRWELIQSKLLDLSARNYAIEKVTPLIEAEEAIAAESLEDRTGYDPDFLDTKVPLPELSHALKGKVAPLKEGDQVELKYQHFSILMHAERKMAIYTVSNIDGNKMYAIRRGRDRWYYDPRMEEKYQAGQALYSSNNFHRGHLVRRLDPVWGDNREVAQKAMEDTFFWTNCTPQHKRFNPVSWLNLEDYILDNADTKNIKVTLFTGPVFKGSDKPYRDHHIPDEFWKVAVVDNTQTNELSATAYMLSQKEFIGDMEFVFGAYKTYQVALSKIEKLTGLHFGLSDFDPLSESESIIKVINRADDINL